MLFKKYLNIGSQYVCTAFSSSMTVKLRLHDFKEVMKLSKNVKSFYTSITIICVNVSERGVWNLIDFLNSVLNLNLIFWL